MDVINETKEVLNEDCHKCRELAMRQCTIEAANLYEKHILLFQDYILGRRVLH